MRLPSRKLMKVDCWIQVFLILPLITSSIVAATVHNDYALLAAFIQFLLGAWQLLSSLYTNFVLQLKSRRIHLLLCGLVFLFIFLIAQLDLDLNRSFRQYTTLFVYLSFIIPQTIAIYYCWLTYSDFKRLDDVEKKRLFDKDLEDDILDAGMVGEE